MGNNNIPVVTDNQVLDSELSQDGSERETLERGQTIVIPMSKEAWEAYLQQKFGKS